MPIFTIDQYKRNHDALFSAMKGIMVHPGDTIDLIMASATNLSASQYDTLSHAKVEGLETKQFAFAQNLLIGYPGESPKKEYDFNDFKMGWRLAATTPGPMALADGVSRLLFLIAAAGVSFAIVGFTTKGDTFKVNEEGKVEKVKGVSLFEGIGGELGKGASAALGEVAPGLTKAIFPILLLLLAYVILQEQWHKR